MKSLTQVLFAAVFGICFGKVVWRNYNPNGPNHQKYAISCLNDVTEEIFDTEAVIFVLITNELKSPGYQIQNGVLKQMNEKMAWSITVVGDDEMTFESSEICLNCPVKNGEKEILKRNFIVEYKAESIVFVVDSVDNFKERFSYLVEHRKFEPVARVLVYLTDYKHYKEDAFKILSALWERFIYEVVVVVPRNLLQFDVYTLDVFGKSEICGNNPKLKKIQICTKGRLPKRQITWPIPQSLNNCTFNAVAREYRPFVISSDYGFEIDILKALESKMQVRINVTVEDESLGWGTKPHGKKFWSGRFGLIQNTSVIGIGAVPIDERLAEDFDYSWAYFYDRIVWVTPKAEKAPKWLCVFVIFSPELWLVCLATYVAAAVALWMSARVFKDVALFRFVGSSFCAALQVFVGTATSRQPVGLLTRVLFVSLALYNMVLSSFYQSSLIHYLTSNIYLQQIDTSEEILSYGLEIGGTTRSKQMFNSSTDDISKEIYDKFKVIEHHDSVTYWLKKTAETKNTCTVSNEFYVKYLVSENDHLVVVNNTPKIFVSDEQLRFQPIQIIMSNGFPLQDRINEIIKRIIAAGLVKKWTSSYLEQLKKMDSMEDDVETVLTLHHTQGVFALLILGWILGFVAFLLEVVVKKIKGLIKKKRV